MWIILAVLVAIAGAASMVMMFHWPIGSAVSTLWKSDFRNHADRIAQIRSGGSGADGIHLLSDPLKISEDDYLLMGCDNATTTRNYPNVPRDIRSEGRWFAAGSDFKEEHAGGNAHGTYRKDGTVEIEAFYTILPSSKYQASPEEVAWHYVRLKELKKQNIPQDQRRAMMAIEAETKPWESMLEGR